LPRRPLNVDTTPYTGRSPKDKFLVREPGSDDRIWWGDVNAEISEAHFEGLREKVVEHLGRSDLYVVDAFAGADPKHRIAVRVVTNHPYHALFARTMFIDPSEQELRKPSRRLGPTRPGSSPIRHNELHGHFVPSTSREEAGRRQFYAGEIKSRSSAMNDRLPSRTSSRCTARRTGDVGTLVTFFGLSGTGDDARPIRSAGDRRRRARLGRRGRLNFEGGSYAR
jgi:phosphoenolpyruvate carboxykinase (ATP)